MTFDEQLAERVRDMLGGHAGVTERKMFGSIGFMLDGQGWVLMHPDALQSDEDLWRRIEPAVEFAASLPPK